MVVLGGLVFGAGNVDDEDLTVDEDVVFFVYGVNEDLVGAGLIELLDEAVDVDDFLTLSLAGGELHALLIWSDEY